jgi:hypothetical protein
MDKKAYSVYLEEEVYRLARKKCLSLLLRESSLKAS